MNSLCVCVCDGLGTTRFHAPRLHAHARPVGLSMQGIGNHNCVYWNGWDMKDVSPALCLRDTVGNLYSGYSHGTMHVLHAALHMQCITSIRAALPPSRPPSLHCHRFAFWAQMSGVQYPLVCQLPFGDDDGHGGDDCHGSDWRDIVSALPLPLGTCAHNAYNAHAWLNVHAPHSSASRDHIVGTHQAPTLGPTPTRALNHPQWFRAVRAPRWLVDLGRPCSCTLASQCYLRGRCNAASVAPHLMAHARGLQRRQHHCNVYYVNFWLWWPLMMMNSSNCNLGCAVGMLRVHAASKCCVLGVSSAVASMRMPVCSPGSSEKVPPAPRRLSWFLWPCAVLQ